MLTILQDLVALEKAKITFFTSDAVYLDTLYLYTDPQDKSKKMNLYIFYPVV